MARPPAAGGAGADDLGPNSPRRLHRSGIVGTYRLGRLDGPHVDRYSTAPSITCTIEAGGVLLMRPLLLHASSAGSEATHRRVIHIDYAASGLDGGLPWKTSDAIDRCAMRPAK